MKTMKKLSALVLALVMVFAMSATAFAADSDPNFTKSVNSAYSTATTAGKSVTVLVGPADDYYYYTGFSSENAAKATTVTANTDADNFTYTVTAVEDTNYDGDECYASAITVTPATGFYGPISFRAVPANAASAWTYVDMTVYVEPATSVSASNVKVEVIDLKDNTGLNLSGTINSVEGSESHSTSPFKGADGCAQKYATAGSALFELVGTDFTQSGGYVSSINGLTQYSSADWTEYYGWNYCVLHNVNGTYVMDTNANIVSASVMPVETNDVVIWAFGTASVAASHFAARLAALNS